MSGGSKTRCEECDIRVAVEARRKSGRVGSDLPPSSAKIRKILELLENIDNNTDGREKTIIFSQFTSMLDLLEPFLRDEGINYVRCKFACFAPIFCFFLLLFSLPMESR